MLVLICLRSWRSERLAGSLSAPSPGKCGHATPQKKIGWLLAETIAQPVKEKRQQQDME
jgi:hypothetical protein